MIKTLDKVWEREQACQAQKAHKQFKKNNPSYYAELRSKLIKSIINHPVPTWDNVSLIITKNGV